MSFPMFSSISPGVGWISPRVKSLSLLSARCQVMSHQCNYSLLDIFSVHGCTRFIAGITTLIQIHWRGFRTGFSGSFRVSQVNTRCWCFVFVRSDQSHFNLWYITTCICSWRFVKLLRSFTFANKMVFLSYFTLLNNVLAWIWSVCILI